MRTLVLELVGDEIAVVKAAIATGLQELERTGQSEYDHARLAALARRVDALPDRARTRLPLQPEDAELLRACVTRVMAMRGYFAGRPAAIVALASVRTKLDRLLEGGWWPRLARYVRSACLDGTHDTT